MKKLISLSLLLAGSLMFLASCTKVNPAPEPVQAGVYLETNGSLGKILVDEKGMTLYYFSKDADGQSACLDDCLASWPLYYNDNPTIGTDLDAKDFDVITRSDGSKQTTYKGWPLYYFINDNAKGDVKGEGVKDVWFVAKPDYSVMLSVGQLKGADGMEYKSDYSPGTELTPFLTDANGRTLYRFVKDSANNNNFTAPDFSNNNVWPIYEVDPEKVPTGFNTADFGEIDVFGKKQMTYKGWPLYYFGQDAKRGETRGVSVPKPGVWPIVNKTTTTAPGGSTESSDGYGY